MRIRIGSTTLGLLLLLPLVIAITGCEDNKLVNDPRPDRGRFALRFVHASPSANRVDMAVAYKNATTPLFADRVFSESFPSQSYYAAEAPEAPDEFGYSPYQLLLREHAGTRLLAPPLTILPSTGDSVTVFMADSLNEVRLVLLTDRFVRPQNPETKATLRFVNLDADAGRLGLRIAYNVLTILPIEWGLGSDFRTVPAGTYDLEVTDGSGFTRLTRLGFVCAPGRSYTVYYTRRGLSHILQ